LHAREAQALAGARAAALCGGYFECSVHVDARGHPLKHLGDRPLGTAALSMSTCEQRWALHYTVERPSRAGAERRGPCCSGERRQSAPCAPTASSEKAVVGWTAPHAHTRQSERPPATRAQHRVARPHWAVGSAGYGSACPTNGTPHPFSYCAATADRLGTHRGADEEDELCEREVGHARAAVGLVRAPLLELLC
jgi:hypothetical protein